MGALWKKQNIKYYVLALVVTAAFLLIFRYSLMTYLNEKNIERMIKSVGRWGPILFIIINILRPLFLLPVGLFSVVAGIMFGPFYGTVYTVIGTIMGSVVAFYIARRFGRGFIISKFGNKIDGFQRLSKDYGFIIMLLLRVTPILPVDVISYGAGLTDMNIWKFVIGTALGILPGTFVWVYLGSAITAWDMGQLTMAILLMAAAIFIPLIFKDKIKTFISK